MKADLDPREGARLNKTCVEIITLNPSSLRMLKNALSKAPFIQLIADKIDKDNPEKCSLTLITADQKQLRLLLGSFGEVKANSNSLSIVLH